MSHDQRGAMRSPLMTAASIGLQLNWRPFYSPLKRAWEMRLQCYKTRPWSSSPYSLSKALCHLSLCPLHLFPLFPLSSRAPLVTLSTRALSVHIWFILHFSELYPSALTPSAIFFVVPKDEKKKCQNLKKNTRQWIFIDNTLTVNIFPLFCPLLLLTCLTSSFFSLFTQPNIRTIDLFLGVFVFKSRNIKVTFLS